MTSDPPIAMGKNDILSVSGISKRFGALTALNRFSMTVAEGEILGIAGPNGSGKSTLFNVISGIPFSVDEGDIVFRGRSIARLRGDQIARRGIARIFQRETEFTSLTVFDNVLVAAAFGAGLGGEEARQAARSALEVAEFEPGEYGRSAAEIPIFTKKRLMIASALAMKPGLLLLDEPASGLTRPEVERIKSLVLKLNGNGLTIILIEHVLALLLAVSHRLVILNEGQELASGLPDDVINDPRVVEAYLGSSIK